MFEIFTLIITTHFISLYNDSASCPMSRVLIVSIRYPNDPLAGDAKQRAGKLVANPCSVVAPAVLRS
jgi:hypothetical protein